ncbi:hypothetical protein Nepgr_032140 [Nepenthes gracilis]|uniref:Uncharacterized protein n=1 Tax=Nepenthes gracilis TaxID=150966 RepID=A0AAD3Y5F1_NEPGR|nr:hypothetical protein Nepgr_032140 [Nepenthes gracilis]
MGNGRWRVLVPVGWTLAGPFVLHPTVLMLTLKWRSVDYVAVCPVDIWLMLLMLVWCIGVAGWIVDFLALEKMEFGAAGKMLLALGGKLLLASCLWLHCCDGDFGDLERLIQFFGACRLEVASRMVCIGS